MLLVVPYLPQCTFGVQVVVALKELVVKQVEVVDMPLGHILSNLEHIKL
jgi:glutaredoxin-related protein